MRVDPVLHQGGCMQACALLPEAKTQEPVRGVPHRPNSEHAASFDLDGGPEWHCIAVHIGSKLGARQCNHGFAVEAQRGA